MAPHSLPDFLDHVRSHLSRIELPVLLLVMALLGGVWAFLEVTDEVLEGEARPIDRTILLSMRSADDVREPIGPAWVEELGRDFTALGGVGVLVFLTFAAVIYLLLMKRVRVALFVFFAVSGGTLLSMLFKTVFDRSRPDLVPHGSHVYSASFPSGHSMMAAIVYLTLGALLARLHSGRAIKVYFICVAALLTLAVGVSRVFMGVHWPTDVVAGWALGAVWATLCWLGALWFQHHGMLEGSDDGEPLNEAS